MTTYAYNAANNIPSKTPDPSFQAPAVTYAYNGSRQFMTDSPGTSQYFYDGLSGLSRKRKPTGEVDYSYGREPDAYGVLIRCVAGV